MKRPLLVAAYVPFVAGAVAFWVVSSMERPPLPEELVFWNSDKLLHALAYGGLAVLAVVGTSTRRGGPGRAARLEAALLASMYGIVDELHQSFVPGRSASIADWLADSLGALAGAFVAGSAFVVLRRARRR